MKNMKKKKANPHSVIFMILMSLLSVFMFMFSLKYMIAVEKKFGLEDSFLPLILFYIIFVAAYYFSIIIHESGHLVMGLLTGYKFVSFRIGSVTFVKEKGKLVRKRFSIPGTAGQCVLTHDPVSSPEEIKYFWYHFGGVFFNILTAAVTGIVMLVSGNVVVDWIMIVFMLVSIILALMNIIPLDIGVANDGMNILMQEKSPETRLQMLNVLIINGMQYEGKRLSEIPEELFKGADPEGDAYPVNLALVYAQRYFCTYDFEAAEDILLKIANNDNVTGVILNEAKCELMFCEIVLDRDKEKITSVYDENLKKYINQTSKYFPGRRRLMYAYYLIIENDLNKAENEYSQAKLMRDISPCLSEYECEMELFDYLNTRR